MARARSIQTLASRHPRAQPMIVNSSRNLSFRRVLPHWGTGSMRAFSRQWAGQHQNSTPSSHRLYRNRSLMFKNQLMPAVPPQRKRWQ
eukprot:10319090-Karenia_brevis.AAC.1